MIGLKGPQMTDAAAELCLDVVKNGTRSTDRGEESGAAVTVEGLHFKMLFQRVFGLIDEKRIGIVALRRGEQIKFTGLLLGVEQLARAEPGKFVFEGGFFRKLGQAELSGGVLDVGKAKTIFGTEHGRKVV